MILVVLTHLYLIYSSQYAVSTVDRSVSPDERYTVVLQTVGWQEARLTLRKSGEKISVFNFPYGDDLLNIEADEWSCEWETDRAEVIIYDPIKDCLLYTSARGINIISLGFRLRKKPDKTPEEEAAARAFILTFAWTVALVIIMCIVLAVMTGLTMSPAGTEYDGEYEESRTGIIEMCIRDRLTVLWQPTRCLPCALKDWASYTAIQGAPKDEAAILPI